MSHRPLPPSGAAARLRTQAEPAPPSLAQLSDDVLLDAKAVARLLGISERQVGRLEDLPFVYISPRVKRWRVADLRAWIASRVRGGAAERALALGRANQS